MAKILVVDDMPDNIRLLQYDLEDEGYEVISATNGKRALERVKTEAPDAILLDIMMPEMDGIEVCKQLKTNPVTAKIPVIMISAKGDEADIILGLDAGAQDYIAKPFSYPIVGARVRSAVRIKEATDTIAQKNAELEVFAFAASHDLQGPLRRLISFTGLLTKDLGGDISEKSKKYLHFITDSSLKMRTLVMDLLEFARLGKEAFTPKPINLNKLVTPFLETFPDENSTELQPQISKDDLPTVLGDVTLITQIYRNLIGNAQKYVADGIQPIIRLTASTKGKQVTLGVLDNGIGIEEKFAKQVFSPFRRLHTSQEFEGSGIGLAACQKASDLLSGKIWVESSLGKGAHFKFTLPLYEPKVGSTNQQEQMDEQSISS